MVADDQPSSTVALTGLSRTLLARGARGALQLGGLLLPAARRPAAAAAGSAPRACLNGRCRDTIYKRGA